jgi:Anti-sigma factor NepR
MEPRRGFYVCSNSWTAGARRARADGRQAGIGRSMDENSLRARTNVTSLLNENRSEAQPRPRLRPSPAEEKEGNVLPMEPARRREARRRKSPSKIPIEEHIGRQLRSLYDDVLAQPIPDRFLDLLKQLEAQSGPKKEGET